MENNNIDFDVVDKLLAENPDLAELHKETAEYIHKLEHRIAELTGDKNFLSNMVHVVGDDAITAYGTASDILEVSNHYKKKANARTVTLKATKSRKHDPIRKQYAEILKQGIGFDKGINELQIWIGKNTPGQPNGYSDRNHLIKEILGIK